MRQKLWKKIFKIQFKKIQLRFQFLTTLNACISLNIEKNVVLIISAFQYLNRDTPNTPIVTDKCE